MEFQIPLTGWIWLDGWRDPGEAQLVRFRKTFSLAQLPERLPLEISADSRYKLFVNGTLISVGPSKGDRLLWFADKADIAPCLRRGENVLAVETLRYPPDQKKGNHSVFRTATPGLYIKETETAFGLSTDSSWKCRPDNGFSIVSESPYFAPLHILEDRRGDKSMAGWRLPGFAEKGWETPMCYSVFQMDQAVSPRNLFPRTIPPMRLEPKKFAGLFGRFHSSLPCAEWETMLAGGGSVTVPAHSREAVEINAGELTTGYLSLRMSGGAGGRATILTSEGYVQKGGNGEPEEPPKKADRLDWENGVLHGFTDVYRPDGGEDVYEPFWFRTFRFVRLEIVTEDEPLRISGFDYLETGYPLEVKTQVETSDESLAPVWDVSLRTLKRCMHETYEDCPFYEQLQYAMDSRSQILYTYMISGDDRLARKCMDDFRRSQRYDGMINCSYPNFGPNVIPGFSIYYILMLFDHMMFFGDREFLRRHMGAIDGVLEYFRRSLDGRGLVGKTGGRNGWEPYWSFIDWTPQWDETSGMPAAGLQGPITMESLLYILGLSRAADILEYLGRSGVAEEYRGRAEEVRKAVARFCTDENGVVEDGPGVKLYSQHCQVFALLTDTVSPEQGRANLEKSLDDSSAFAPCSVAMAYYLFRALEKAGLYQRTDKCWDLWRDMVRKNLTTCVEDNVRERSDCHAWGALALYELPAVTLGVRPAAPGFEKILVRPAPGAMTWAKGRVVTPKGTVAVEWERKNGALELKIDAPAGVEIVR